MFSLDVLGAAGWGEVDSRGGVTPATNGWKLDWWVRSSERWHKASEDPAVRQCQLGPSAVVQTRMRVPDGDAVQQVWAVAVSGGPAVAVMEIGNESATAFAFAVLLEAPKARIAASPQGVWVDGQPVLRWDRAPAEVAMGPQAIAGLAGSEVPAPGVPMWCINPRGTNPRGLVYPGPSRTAASTKGSDAVGLVWPLPHTACFALSAGLAPGRVPQPSDLPDAQAVIRGWESHLDRGARIEVPDDSLARRIQQNRRRWLGLTGRMESADVVELSKLAVRLDHHGYHSGAELVLDEIVTRWTTDAPAERLRAFAVHHDLTGDAEAAGRYVEAVAEAVEAAARAGREVPVGALKRLLGAAGEQRAAQDLDTLALVPSGADADGLRAELVDDHGSELLIAPGYRHQWHGGSLAVYGLPTRFGPLSYAVRWHGARPALLWELDLRVAAEMPTLRTPALDDAWRSVEACGETLLAAPG